MSFCTTASCLAHRQQMFIRLDQGEPYPWVHTGGMAPCGSVPPVTAEQAGEVCGCGCPSSLHAAPDEPIPAGALAHRRACTGCGCPDFTHERREAA